MKASIGARSFSALSLSAWTVAAALMLEASSARAQEAGGELPVEVQMAILDLGDRKIHEKERRSYKSLREDLSWCVDEKARLDQDLARIELIPSAALAEAAAEENSPCPYPEEKPLDPATEAQIDAMIAELFAPKEPVCTKKTELLGSVRSGSGFLACFRASSAACLPPRASVRSADGVRRRLPRQQRRVRRRLHDGKFTHRLCSMTSGAT